MLSLALLQLIHARVAMVIYDVYEVLDNDLVILQARYHYKKVHSRGAAVAARDALLETRR